MSASSPRWFSQLQHSVMTSGFVGSLMWYVSMSLRPQWLQPITSSAVDIGVPGQMGEIHPMFAPTLREPSTV